MIKKIFFSLLLASGILFAQTPPKARTPYLRLNLYESGARQVAEGLNWNFSTIDTSLDNNQYEWLVNQVRVTNGNLLVSSGAKVKQVYKDGVGNIVSIKFEDVTQHNVAPFTKDDIIFHQTLADSGVTFDVNKSVTDTKALIKRHVYKIIKVDSIQVWVTPLADSPQPKGEIKKGDSFIRIGNTNPLALRMGSIGLYADMPYAPYIDVRDSVRTYKDFLSDSLVYVRIGRLDGLYDYDFAKDRIDMKGYGIYTRNGYFKGNIYIKNTKQVKDSLGVTNVETSLIQEIGARKRDSVTVLAQLALKASATDVLFANSRIDTANAKIAVEIIRANNAEANLLSSINLKADATTVNTLTNRVSSAEASITLETTRATDAELGLSARINMKVGANDVYSLLQILPDSVKIQSKNIILNGATVATSLQSQNVSAVSFNTFGGGTLDWVMVGSNGIGFWSWTGDTWTSRTLSGSDRLHYNGETVVYMSDMANYGFATQSWVSSQGYLLASVFNSAPASTITQTDISSWNSAAITVSDKISEAYWTTIYYKDQNGNNASMQVLTVP